MGSGGHRCTATAAHAGDAAVTLTEFEKQVFSVALGSPICGVPTARRLTATSISLRVEISTGGFVDVFFNEQTGTTAYALIREGRRVFGADSTGGWHLHPSSDPGNHIPLPATLSFAEFVAQIEHQGDQAASMAKAL